MGTFSKKKGNKKQEQKEEEEGKLERNEVELFKMG